MTETSPPPPAAEPDTLRGELIERCTTLIDLALDGSLYAVQIISNTLGGYAPGLVPPLVDRCSQARRRKQ